MTSQSNCALNRSGTALLHAARLQAEIARQPNDQQLDDAGYGALLAQARACLSAANPKDDPHKFAATKTALEALEAIERGGDPLGGITIFKGLVESVHGGQRDINFGGRPRQGSKPSTDQAFFRAAAVALWKRFPDDHEKLVSQARSLIEKGTSNKLQKLVENFEQKHDVNILKSRSPLSVHMPLLNDLIENHGYRNLKDFV